MALNVALEGVIGIVPFAGDVQRHAREDGAADAEAVRLAEDVARGDDADQIADERHEPDQRIEADGEASARDRDRAVKQPGDEREALARAPLLFALGREHLALEHALRSIIHGSHSDHLTGDPAMTIKVGERLPAGKLMES